MPVPEDGPAEPVVEVTLATSFDALRRVRADWDACVAAAGSDIYFTVDWLETWWTAYGTGRRLACLMLRVGGQAVAALPFCITRFWLGPVPVRVAGFVGAQTTISVFRPAIMPGHERAALAAAFDQLLGQEGCAGVSLSPLSGDTTLADAVRALAADRPDIVIAAESAVVPHTLIDLPDSFEAYLKALDKQQRSNYRRDLKQLKTRFALAHRVVTGAEAPAAFERFAALHEAQWRAAGGLGHFGDWPGSLAFNRALVERLAPSDRVVFYELTGNGELLSSQYCFVLGSTCFWRLPARQTEKGLDKLGLGRIGLIKMIEALIGQGVSRIEAGPGHYDYKLRHGGTELGLVQLMVARAAPWAILRVHLLLAWARFLNFAYYRVWFLKLARWLGLPRRPLWQSWIRTRF